MILNPGDLAPDQKIGFQASPF